MANIELMVESLEQAKDTVGFTLDSLDDALKNADAVQALVLMVLIAETKGMQEKIDRLLNAVKSED